MLRNQTALVPAFIQGVRQVWQSFRKPLRVHPCTLAFSHPWLQAFSKGLPDPPIKHLSRHASSVSVFGRRHSKKSEGWFGARFPKISKAKDGLRRSEERRVGKECRSRWWRCHCKRR